MFLNPLMLAGLGAAVLPVVLHLLSRARYREVQWGAMMFLGEQHRRQQHVARLKQMVLLLLRVGTIAAVALAMARPVVRKAGAVLSEEGRISAVIILDRSASMGYEENGRSRFDEAKRGVLNVLANLRRGDEAALILMGGGAGDEPDEADTAPPQPGTDLQAIAQRVDDLRPGYGKADLGAALTQAQRILDSEQNRNREVYVIADRQATTWASVTPAVQQAWRVATHDEQSPVRLFFVPVGGEESDNAAIESVAVLGPPLVRDAAAGVEVRIRNYGSTPRPALPLTLSAGGRELVKTSVSLAANSAVTTNSTLRFPIAGSQVLTARITSAGMRGDDQFDTAIDIREPLRVQLITPAANTTANGAAPAAGGEQFLRLALAPYATSGETGSADPAIVTTSSPDRWPPLTGERTDVVILSGLPGLTLDQVRDLEEFVYSGGGLIIAPGPASRLPIYNALLYRGGTGMLPAELHATPDATPPTRIASLDLTHPLFQFLRGVTNPAPAASIAHFVAVDTHGGGEARVLGTYASGGPFLLERPYGRGRVVLVTTSLDGSWNALPLSGFFLPFVQSLTRYAAVLEPPNRNLSPGQPIDASFSSPGEDATVTLTLPSGATRPLDLVQTGDRYEVHYAATHQPGRYTLRLRSLSAAARRPEQVLHYVVRTPRDESDLTPVPRAQWPVLSEAMGLRLLESDKDAIVAAASSARTGRELYLAVLAAAGAMAVMELVLGRLWSGEI